MNEDLQKAASDAAKKYVEMMFPNLEDLEKKAWLINAAASGYLKGYRDAMQENERDRAPMPHPIEGVPV